MHPAGGEGSEAPYFSARAIQDARSRLRAPACFTGLEVSAPLARPVLREVTSLQGAHLGPIVLAPTAAGAQSGLYSISALPDSEQIVLYGRWLEQEPTTPTGVRAYCLGPEPDLAAWIGTSLLHEMAHLACPSNHRSITEPPKWGQRQALGACFGDLSMVRPVHR